MIISMAAASSEAIMVTRCARRGLCFVLEELLVSTLRSAEDRSSVHALPSGWTTYEPDPLLYRHVWLALIERVKEAAAAQELEVVPDELVWSQAGRWPAALGRSRCSTSSSLEGTPASWWRRAQH